MSDNNRGNEEEGGANVGLLFATVFSKPQTVLKKITSQFKRPG